MNFKTALYLLILLKWLPAFAASAFSLPERACIKVINVMSIWPNPIGSSLSSVSSLNSAGHSLPGKPFLCNASRRLHSPAFFPPHWPLFPPSFFQFLKVWGSTFPWMPPTRSMTLPLSYIPKLICFSPFPFHHNISSSFARLSVS